MDLYQQSFVTSSPFWVFSEVSYNNTTWGGEFHLHLITSNSIPGMYLLGFSQLVKVQPAAIHVADIPLMGSLHASYSIINSIWLTSSFANNEMSWKGETACPSLSPDKDKITLSFFSLKRHNNNYCYLLLRVWQGLDTPDTKLMY